MNGLKIYRIGAGLIGGVIGAGNLTSTVYCASHDSAGLLMVGISLAKGVTYGVMWPVFVPYACVKAAQPPYYIGSKFGKINDNGFVPHIIPGWRMATSNLE